MLLSSHHLSLTIPSQIARHIPTGELSVLHIRNMDEETTQNTVALTGPVEGLQEKWRLSLPPNLKHLAEQYRWETFNP